MNKKIVKGLLAISVVLMFCWYAGFPDYQEFSSVSLQNGTYRETTLNVLVYKEHLNPQLYEMIAENHNKINGVPGKLTMHLFYSRTSMKKGKPYRSVIYDYERNFKYILLE